MKENKLNTFFTWFLLAITLLLPLFFLPYFVNPFVTSKLILIFVLGLFSAFIFIASSVQKKGWDIIKSPFFLPLSLFALLIIISGLASHQYPTKQFLGMGGVYLSFVLVVLLAPSMLQGKLSKWFAMATNIGALILSVLSILQVFGLGIGPLLSRISVFELPNSLVFALSGATFVTIQFLSVVLASNLFDQKTLKESLFNKMVTGFIIIALGVNIWGVLPGKEASFETLSMANSASIAMNSLTLTKNALLGFGPDSYGNAYSILKPIWINGTQNWRFTFDSAANLPLTLIVSSGSIAFIIYLLFIWQAFTVTKKADSKDAYLKAFIFGSLIWQILSPVNFLMFGLLSIALAFLVSLQQDQYSKLSFSVHRLSDLLNNGKSIKARNLIFFGSNFVLIAILVIASVVSAKAFAAYHFLYRGNSDVINNQASMAYNSHRNAKDLAPQVDFVRRSNSLINLQIAIALSNKADVTAAEQEQVLQLINQAITEAKAATVLEPENYQNWISLAQIYIQLLGTTEQAAQEAFNALAKAATYNPNDPEIRIGLGELFLKTERAADAVVFFTQAVERKPDLFIAHYYLAKAQVANNQLQEAKTSYANSLNLLEKDSEDYKTVEGELNALNKALEDQAAEAAKSKSDTASGSASLSPTTQSDNSALSGLLTEQDAESAIQEGALSSDQNLVEN